MKRTHYYKTVSPFFEDSLAGRKTFEVRVDDRDPRPEVGDDFCSQHYDPERQEYTGSEFTAEIVYALRDSRFVLPGHVILGLNNAPVEHYP